MLAAQKSTSADKKIKILFVTGNENKKKEVQQIMGEQFQVDSMAIDLPELQGEIDEISKEKCRIAIQNVLTDPKVAYKYGSEHIIVVEDTSLCFNALNGMPGPYIKWFLEKTGHEGLNKMLVGFEDKTASAVCTLAYFHPKWLQEQLKSMKGHEHLHDHGESGCCDHDHEHDHHHHDHEHKHEHKHEHGDSCCDHDHHHDHHHDHEHKHEHKHEHGEEKCCKGLSPEECCKNKEGAEKCCENDECCKEGEEEWEDECGDEGCGCCGDEVELDLNPKVIRGETTGDIVLPRSAEGPAFGWDPIFQPTGFTQTYAEMPKEQKNTISHRYKAFQALQAALLE